MDDPTPFWRSGGDRGMRYLYQIDRVLFKLERILVILVFGGLAVSIFFNIITRNLFGISFHFILEYSPALVLWLALLGSSMAIASQRHIKIEVLLRLCPPRGRQIAHAVSALFGMGVMGLLLYISVGFVKNEIAMFGWKGGFSVIFPLFFGIALFRFGVAALGHYKADEAPTAGVKIK
jgi:TRAP-type C4-dicarboxylate transport system permease small subunit